MEKEIINFWASIVSLILAIFSLFVSIYFYVQSDKVLNKLNTTVDSLKEFQQTFYTDTFAMLKESFAMFKETQGAVTKKALEQSNTNITEGVAKPD